MARKKRLSKNQKAFYNLMQEYSDKEVDVSYIDIPKYITQKFLKETKEDLEQRFTAQQHDIVDTIKEAEEKKPVLQRTRTGTSGIKMSKSLSVSGEINLLGKTVDEALPELDKYLDDAYLAHLPSVRVVHGKGTGALRNAVQNHLKRVKYVKSYRLGEYGEGDAGVTIVTFKD